MIAYHGDPAVKAKHIARVRAHREAGRLVQEIGWENGRGCAVGCTLESYDHRGYPQILGIPIDLPYLKDVLFELQPNVDAQLWPERFLAAIRPGVDLRGVWSEWAYWMLLDPCHGMIQHAGDFPEVAAAIRDSAEICRVEAVSIYAPIRGVSAEEEAEAEVSAWAAEVSARAAWAAGAPAAAAARAAAWVGRAAWVSAACDKLIALLEAA